MASLDDLATFFGWCTVLHFAVLAVAALALLVVKAPIQRIHARISGLSEEELGGVYFRWLATYKVLVLVFAAVPWLALRCMV